MHYLQPSGGERDEAMKGQTDEKKDMAKLNSEVTHHM